MTLGGERREVVLMEVWMEEGASGDSRGAGGG